MSYSEETKADVLNNIVDTIKNTILVFGGATGILVALLWVLGRSYGRGYYDTVNIPLFQVNLSVWEYGELGWQVLLIGAYIAGVILFLELTSRLPIQPMPRYFRVVFWLLCGLSPYFFLRGDIHLSTKIYIYLFLLFLFAMSLIGSSRGYGALKTEEIKYRNSENTLIFDRILGWTLLIYLIVSFMITTSYDIGTIDGRNFATEKSMKVRVVLNEPLIYDMKATETIIGSRANTYTYDNLYLLLHNDKNYFLFQGINQQCEPEHVYVIQEEHIHSIEYTDMSPLKPNCLP